MFADTMWTERCAHQAKENGWLCKHVVTCEGFPCHAFIVPQVSVLPFDNGYFVEAKCPVCGKHFKEMAEEQQARAQQAHDFIHGSNDD